MRTNNAQAIFDHDGDMSQATLTSQPFQLTNMEGWSFQASTTGDAIGTLDFYFSNDEGNANATNIQISTLTKLPNLSLTINGADTYGVNTSKQFYKWAVAVYTKTSGTGTLSARWNAKGF